jgi:transcriptional regulator GlxA family with amidase domain
VPISTVCETPYRILDVALACGFGDLSEFTRHFKQDSAQRTRLTDNKGNRPEN